jgi:hypothetical protein
MINKKKRIGKAFAVAENRFATRKLPKGQYT